MNRQRIILILVVISSILIGIAIQEASALKESGWFDSRDFYKEINKMDMFDKYPYDSPKLIIKIINTGPKITEKYFLEYVKQDQEIIKPKQFKDDRYKTSFDIEDSSKKKVCLSSLDSSFKKCKSFASFDDKTTITFYLK